MAGDIQGKLNELLSDVYSGKIREQLFLAPLKPIESAPRVPMKIVTSEFIETVGDLKKFIEENNIPDTAHFTDTGFECDGRYQFWWKDAKKAE